MFVCIAVTSASDCGCFHQMPVNYLVFWKRLCISKIYFNAMRAELFHSCYRMHCDQLLSLRLGVITHSGGSRRWDNPAMAPPSKLAMEFGPFGGRKNNYSIVNLSKCKEFAPPPISMLATDLAPSTEKCHIKRLKGR